jgi:hypothetical protein
VFYNMRVEVFTPEGTFAAAASRLDYVQSLGVTAVLLLPVSQGLFPGQAGSPHNNFYGVLRPDVIEPTLGGGAGLKSFVDACHSRGMKVIVDNVPNGIRKDSPYLPTSPDFCGGVDVTRRNTTGQHVMAWGSNVELDWTQPALLDWWSEKIAVAWVRDYGVDGFRCDCEPHYGNEMLWTRVAADVLSATGKHVMIMAEGTPRWDVPASRSYAFHMSQHDYDSIKFNPALPPIEDFYFGNKTIANAIAACGELHATRTITNHDYPHYVAMGRLSVFAYGAAISPFAVHWFTGEEFNQTKNDSLGGVLYFQIQNWDELAYPPSNRLLATRVGSLMRIRQKYLHILRPPPGMPINHTRVAMLPYKVEQTDLPPYIIYSAATKEAIFVLAKRDHTSGDVCVQGFPGLGAALGLSASTRVSVVELMSGTTVMASVTVGSFASGDFTAHVQSGDAKVFLVAAVPSGASLNVTNATDY